MVGFTDKIGIDTTSDIRGNPTIAAIDNLDRGTKIGCNLVPSWFERKQGSEMSRIILGSVCGLLFGAIDIAIMLPMTFPDKAAAITAAFIARFGIGFAIGAARLSWPE